MSDLFDGLADIFVDTFGEPVAYVPRATGIALGADGTIRAIWVERPVFAVSGEADTDAIEATLHVPAAVAPVEGDVATRIKTGKVARVVPPIRPDGEGMIACALELVAA